MVSKEIPVNFRIVLTLWNVSATAVVSFFRTTCFFGTLITGGTAAAVSGGSSCGGGGKVSCPNAWQVMNRTHISIYFFNINYSSKEIRKSWQDQREFWIA